MTTRHKLKRKELKQPDEFQSIVESVGLFFELHLAKVIIGAIAMLVAAALALGVYFYEARRGRAAAARFAQALSEIQNKQYAAAQTALAALAADEPYRAVGRLANLYLASAYLAQEQPAKARAALRRYLADGAGPAFRDIALNNLAIACEDLHDYKAAEAAYREAAKIPGPGQGRAQLGVARMLLAQGKRAEAIAAYRGFLDSNPFARERASVMETLADLGVAPPAARQPPMVRIVKPASVPRH